jgi:hypothetical protein
LPYSPGVSFPLQITLAVPPPELPFIEKHSPVVDVTVEPIKAAAINIDSFNPVQQPIAWRIANGDEVDGVLLGVTLGVLLTLIDGVILGVALILLLGVIDGVLLTLMLGVTLGVTLIEIEGVTLGVALIEIEGVILGVLLTLMLGVTLGVLLTEIEGVTDGVGHGLAV